MGEWTFIIICLVIGGTIGYFSDEINEVLSDKSIKDPTYAEMMQFISDDTTNYNTYVFDSYVCHDFTNDVLANAKANNIRAGYVHLEGIEAHAIVCFDTTDQGLIFMEPQLDIIFTESRMNEMIDYGWYNIDGNFAYFSMYIVDYRIDKWNNDVI